MRVPTDSKRRESGKAGGKRSGKRLVSELGGDVKIPNLWSMLALLDICPKDVKEQMMMRLDENGENDENIKA